MQKHVSFSEIGAGAFFGFGCTITTSADFIVVCAVANTYTHVNAVDGTVRCVVRILWCYVKMFFCLNIKIISSHISFGVS